MQTRVLFNKSQLIKPPKTTNVDQEKEMFLIYNIPSAGELQQETVLIREQEKESQFKYQDNISAKKIKELNSWCIFLLLFVLKSGITWWVEGVFK